MNIRRFRTEQGMKQSDLARLMEVDRTTITKWESGVSSPCVEKLVLLAKCLNVTIDELLCKGDEK